MLTNQADKIRILLPLLLSLLVVGWGSVCNADIIYLKSGDTIEGEVIKWGKHFELFDEDIRIKSKEGETLTHPFTEVSRVEYYYPDGTLHEEIHYKDGKADGVHNTYHPNGVIMIEMVYADGVLVSTKTYDQSGNLKFEKP